MTSQHSAPFEETEASDSTGFLLWQLTSQWHRSIAAALKPHELTQVQFVLLASLTWLENRKRHITQVMLARHANLDVMVTSQVLRSLQARGLVERAEHPTDTRAKAITLTSTGRDLANITIPVVETADTAFFGARDERRRALNAELRRLISAI